MLRETLYAKHFRYTRMKRSLKIILPSQFWEQQRKFYARNGMEFSSFPKFIKASRTRSNLFRERRNLFLCFRVSVCTRSWNLSRKLTFRNRNVFFKTFCKLAKLRSQLSWNSPFWFKNKELSVSCNSRVRTLESFSMEIMFPRNSFQEIISWKFIAPCTAGLRLSFKAWATSRFVLFSAKITKLTKIATDRYW